MQEITRDNTGDINKEGGQDGPRHESKDTRTAYLRENFWPLCGMTGGVLLFVAAAAAVPP